MRTRLFLLLAAIATLSVPAAAQLAPHDVVRFTDEHGRLVRGTVASIDSASMRLESADGLPPAEFAFKSIYHVQLLRGRHAFGPRAIGVGAGIGAVAGAVVGVAASDQGSSDIHIDAPGRALIGGVLGAAAGTVIGTVVAFFRTDEWMGVRLPGQTRDQAELNAH